MPDVAKVSELRRCKMGVEGGACDEPLALVSGVWRCLAVVEGRAGEGEAHHPDLPASDWEVR